MFITIALILGTLLVTAVSLLTVVDGHHFSTAAADGI